MDRPRVFAMLLLAAVLQSCLPLPLHPVYRDEELVCAPALLGTWEAAGGEETCRFEKSQGEKYRLTITDDAGKKVAFCAALTTIDTMLFLDLSPSSFDTILSVYHTLHFVPGHSFCKVGYTDTTLRMAMMSVKWLRGLLRQKPHLLDCEDVSGALVITSGTEQVRGFLRGYAGDSLAFGAPTVFRKQGG